MTANEILTQLESLGQASIKKVLLKHDIREPLYGVKVEELKKIQKKTKQDHALSLQLYASGVYDAMYLAGLIAEPEKMSVTDLQKWVQQANGPVLCSNMVAWVAAESNHGMDIAMKWIAATDQDTVTAGWATLSSIVATKDDSELDIPLLKKLLDTVAKNMHSSSNRVKSAMNGFVISVGTHVKELSPAAMQTGKKIGKVAIDVGDTACKVPYAPDYIEKAESKGAIGKKRKSARC